MAVYSRITSDGTFDVQFIKIWGATLLNESEELYGSRIIIELLYER